MNTKGIMSYFYAAKRVLVTVIIIALSSTAAVAASAAAPVIKMPVITKPVIKMPAINTPVIKIPATNKPVIKMPAIKIPAIEKPVIKKPATKKPATKKPATKKPATKKPAKKKPATKKPAIKKPAIKMQAINKPVIKMPAINKPVIKMPVIEKPVKVGNVQIEQPLESIDPQISNEYLSGQSALDILGIGESMNPGGSGGQRGMTIPTIMEMAEGASVVSDMGDAADGIVSVGVGATEGVVEIIGNGFDGQRDSALVQTIRAVVSAPLVAFAAMLDYAAEDYVVGPVVKGGVHLIVAGYNEVGGNGVCAGCEEGGDEEEGDLTGGQEAGGEEVDEAIAEEQKQREAAEKKEKEVEEESEEESSEEEVTEEEAEKKKKGKKGGVDGTNCPPDMDGCDGDFGDYDIDHPAFAAFRALSIDKLDWLRDFDPTIDPSGEHQNSGPYTGPSLDDFNDSHGGTSTGFWGNVGSSINEKLEYNLQSLANSHGGRSTGNGLPVE